MTLRCGDSTTVADIPDGLDAVLGYADGHPATMSALAARFPHLPRISLTVNGSTPDADGVDVEPGNIQNSGGAAWVADHPRLKHGFRPIAYTFLANTVALVNATAAHGISRTQIRVWTAHWTGHPHLCGPPCGLPWWADATQYADPATSGGHYDLSLLADDFFGQPTPTPAPATSEEDQMQIMRKPATTKAGPPFLILGGEPYPIGGAPKDAEAEIDRHIKQGAVDLGQVSDATYAHAVKRSQ